MKERPGHLAPVVLTIGIVAILCFSITVILMTLFHRQGQQRAGWTSPILLRIGRAILQPPFLKPKIGTTIAYSSMSYAGQPATALQVAIDRGQALSLEIHDPALATPKIHPAQNLPFEVILRLNNGEAMSLNAPTTEIARQLADDLQHAIRRYNEAHHTHVRIQITSW